MDAAATLAIGLGAFMLGVLFCIPIAYENEKLRRKLNDSSKK
jgi:hypothetical protein